MSSRVQVMSVVNSVQTGEADDGTPKYRLVPLDVYVCDQCVADCKGLACEHLDWELGVWRTKTGIDCPHCCYCDMGSDEEDEEEENFCGCDNEEHLCDSEDFRCTNCERCLNCVGDCCNTLERFNHYSVAYALALDPTDDIFHCNHGHSVSGEEYDLAVAYQQMRNNGTPLLVVAPGDYEVTEIRDRQSSARLKPR